MSFSPRSTDPEPSDVHRNASWGALISIVVILAMIVVGAFYAWGKRIAEVRDQEAAAAQSFTTSTTTTYTTSTTTLPRTN